MTNVLENAKSHFRSIIDKGLMGPIIVPEWGDAEVYYRPTISLHQQSESIKLNQEGKQVEALVVMLIARALDAEGKPLFKKAEKTVLLREVDPDIILRIIEEINVNTADVDTGDLGNS